MNIAYYVFFWGSKILILCWVLMTLAVMLYIGNQLYMFFVSHIQMTVFLLTGKLNDIVTDRIQSALIHEWERNKLMMTSYSKQ